MPLGPRKKTGFRQSIYEQSATKKERIGRRMDLDNGKVFVYGLAGGALSPAYITVSKNTASADIITALGSVTVATAGAIGDTKIAITLGGSCAISANMLEGSTLFFKSSATAGTAMQYSIAGNTACAAAAITLFLDSPLVKAAAANLTAKIIPSPWGLSGVTNTTLQAATPTGVPLIAVTTNYFAWFQTEGFAAVYGDATVTTSATVGCPLVASTVTAGSVARVISLANTTYQYVGYMAMTSLAGSTLEPVFLRIRS